MPEGYPRGSIESAHLWAYRYLTGRERQTNYELVPPTITKSVSEIPELLMTLSILTVHVYVKFIISTYLL